MSVCPPHPRPPAQTTQTTHHLKVEHLRPLDLLRLYRHRRSELADIVRHVRVQQTQVLLKADFDRVGADRPAGAGGGDYYSAADGAVSGVAGSGAGVGVLRDGEAVAVVVDGGGGVEGVEVDLCGGGNRET